MASASWSVTKRKRPSTPAASSSSRKRTRRSEDPTGSLRRQQTLTQVEWITSRTPSFEDDTELQPIEMARTSERRRTNGRDSTLTQIDFFGNRTAVRDLDAEPLYGDGVVQMPPPPVPQLDGSHDGPRKTKSPRRQRKRKWSPQPMTLEQIAIDPEYNESQEWQPSRRKSRRNVDVGYALASTKPRRSTTQPVRPQPVLEIQDSTATDEQDENLPTNYEPEPPADQPETPTKGRPIVLSSQSPESLPPSTRRKRADMKEESPARSPLRERSINIPNKKLSASVQAKHYVKMSPQRIENPSSALQRRPQQRKTRVEDSQSNLWSYPMTSSPKKAKDAVAQLGVSSVSSDSCATLERTERRSSGLTEIPSTSQAHPPRVLSSPPDVTMKYNSPSRSHSSQRRLNQASEHSIVQHDVKSATAVQLEQRTAAPEATVEAQSSQPQANSQLPAKMLTTPRKTINATDDEGSEWGSPIANTTQYNVDLDHRTSSPSRSQLAAMQTTDNNVNKDERTQESGEGPEMATFINGPDPKIRLVSSSRPTSKDGKVSQTAKKPSNDSEESLLPTVPAINQVVNGSITTRVLLNDLRQTSSSPADESNKTTTQRSVRPASMPHPSQMSTQEATQAYLGLSSMMQPNADTQTPKTVTAITIKDSSSMRVALSQIPAHMRSQSQGHAIVDFGLGDFDDEEDQEDLNPPSSEPPTTKFPSRKSDQLARDAEPQPSSSPTEELDPADVPAHIRQRLEAAQKSRSAGNHDASGPLTGQRQVPIEDQETVSVVDDDFDNQQEADPGRSDIAPNSSPFEEPSQGHKRQYSPIEGFDNETQSNFTQGGHVTAAYIHRQRDAGLLPTAYTPKPFQVPGFTGR